MASSAVDRAADCSLRSSRAGSVPSRPRCSNRRRRDCESRDLNSGPHSPAHDLRHREISNCNFHAPQGRSLNFASLPGNLRVCEQKSDLHAQVGFEHTTISVSFAEPDEKSDVRYRCRINSTCCGREIQSQVPQLWSSWTELVDTRGTWVCSRQWSRPRDLRKPRSGRFPNHECRLHQFHLPGIRAGINLLLKFGHHARQQF